jgi:hypothetical protein
MEYNSYPSWYLNALNREEPIPIHTPNSSKSGVSCTVTSAKKSMKVDQVQNDDDVSPSNLLMSEQQAQQRNNVIVGMKERDQHNDVITRIEMASTPLFALSAKTSSSKSANVPGRIISALDMAATPLLETMRDMIQMVQDESLTILLKNVFQFFDLVIRAAKKSAGLYADVIEKNEIDAARQMLYDSIKPSTNKQQ